MMCSCRVRDVLFQFLLLSVISSSSSPQYGSAVDRPVFENADFQIFSLKSPKDSSSIFTKSSLGVIILREKAQGGSTALQCTLCFAGPRDHSGRRSVFIFGTPQGIIPLADNYSSTFAPLSWVGITSDREITEQIFKDQPQQFADSVREDVLAIAFLGSTTGDGLLPSKKEQDRASAGLNDLEIKGKWLSFFEGSPQKPQPFIKVKVHTMHSGVEKGKWNIFYVVDGWEGDRDHTYAFDKESSPTEQAIVPGRYKMWAGQKKKKGPVKTVVVGDTSDLIKELELEVP